MKLELETAAELDFCLRELSEATGRPIPLLALDCLEAEVLGQLAFLRRKRINQTKKRPQSSTSATSPSPSKTGE